MAYIAERMSRFDWPERGTGYPERHRIAEAWGISESRVKDLAAEASRSLRVDPKEREERKAQHGAFAAHVLREAMRRRSKISGLPDYKAALEANRDAARFAGIDPDADAKKPDEADPGLAMRVECFDDVETYRAAVAADQPSTAAPEVPAASEAVAPPPEGAQPPLPPPAVGPSEPPTDG